MAQTFKPIRIKKRGKSFQLYFYNPRGERRRLSAGNDAQQAYRLAAKFTDWILEGKDPESEVVKAMEKEVDCRITVKELYSRFMNEYASNRQESTRTSYQNSFNNISRCKRIVDAQVGNITKRVVTEYAFLRMKQDNVTGSSVNREISFLQSMMSYAVKLGYIEHNPLYGIEKMREAGKRDVNLTTEQVQALLDKLPSPVDDIAEFAIYTGFRRENILGLRIEFIQFHDVTDTGEVRLIIKGGRREIYPLSPNAVALLKKVIGYRKSGYVFLNPQTNNRYTSIKTSFDKAVRDLNLTASDGSKLRFHDLRHVFATWLHRRGVSLDQLRSLMGHKNRSTTDRYATVDVLETGEVLARIPNLRQA